MIRWTTTYALLRLMLVVCCIITAFPNFSPNVLAASTLTLEQPVYFLSPDEEPRIVEPGTYQVEAADAWLKLIPAEGSRTEAVLLEATSGTHDNETATPEVVVDPERSTTRASPTHADLTGWNGISRRRLHHGCVAPKYLWVLFQKTFFLHTKTAPVDSFGDICVYSPAKVCAWQCRSDDPAPVGTVHDAGP